MRSRSSHLVLVLPALERLRQRDRRHKAVLAAHRQRELLVVLRRKARARDPHRRRQKVSLVKGLRLRRVSLVKVAPVVQSLLKVGLSPQMAALVVPRQKAALAAPHPKAMEKVLHPHLPRVKVRDHPRLLRAMAKDLRHPQRVKAKDHPHPQRVKGRGLLPTRVMAKDLRHRAVLADPHRKVVLVDLHREAAELLRHPRLRSNERLGGMN